MSCGLYITTVERGGKLNGCVTNTLMQHSHAPVKLSLTMNKSSRDVDKFAQMPFTIDADGDPLLGGNEISATISMKVYDMLDMGIRTMFLCTPTDTQNGETKAITYSEYQQALKNRVGK